MALPEDKETDNKLSLIRHLRNRFFAGVIIALPIAVTIWLLTWFVQVVDGQILSWVPARWNPNIWVKTQTGLSIPGFGLILGVVALWMLGVLASNFIGTTVLRFGERIVERVPLVSNIYNALKQIVTTMAQQKDRAFRDVCLLEYPRPGLWAVGFVTADLQGAPREHLSDDYVCVFVPTTPNPTSGFLLFSKRQDIKILNMSPEEGVKMIISGGMVTSNFDGAAPTEKVKASKSKLKET